MDRSGVFSRGEANRLADGFAWGGNGNKDGWEMSRIEFDF